MLKKSLLKAGILLFALIMVISAISFFSSLDFKTSVKNFFDFDVKTYTWCPENTVDMIWQDDQVSEKWKKATMSEINNRFCTVGMEPIKNVDLQKLNFKPLLKAQSATAQTALLEWDSQSGVFRAQGLPFYSTSLSRELLDR